MATGVHEMARRLERLEEENAKLKEENARLKTNLIVCSMSSEALNKLRETIMMHLREAKDNIKLREEAISRMIDEGCPNAD